MVHGTDWQKALYRLPYCVGRMILVPDTNQLGSRPIWVWVVMNIKVTFMLVRFFRC